MAVIAVTLIATVTHAGIFGKITKILSVEKILGLAVSGTFGLLGLKFGASKVIKWRKLTTEGVDVDVAIYKSTKPSSPGGAQITGEEIDKILKEGGEFNW